ncbi:hypothetical protein RJ640_012665, partial [Escallonia rubra]
APAIPKKPLAFCPYNGSVCCDSAKDLQLQKQFEAMNISDAACASALKSILCATCDQFSAELYRVASGPRPVPVLCNSTDSRSSYCSTVWDTCQDISISNSPFAPSLKGSAGVTQNSTLSKLTDFWQSKTDFCDSFGGVSDKDFLCFDGKPISLNKTENLLPPKGLCLERIGSGAYINMVAHPDGSNRAFFSNQPGKIWLATVPEQDSGEPLGLDETSPFVDLTDEVHYDTTFGMMGLAFHPNFGHNGRFFASFNCDKVKSPGCTGRCACNSDVDCDPSKLNSSSSSALPCQYHTVIAEFTANGTASEPSMAMKAKASEVRRIFIMGLPFTNNHAGQILFGPADGYLYLMMGDGGSRDDPFNFAQNKKSLLGKILRMDVDNIPSDEEMVKLGLWGKYSIPPSNPFSEDNDLQPEIWARGLRNPWRCSFDAERPSYFVCADVGQDRYEEVNVITKGGNYGWPVYEGPLLSDPQRDYGRNTSADSVDLVFPIMGYTHSDINKKVGSAAISGGYFYRSMTDPCMDGSYLYADLYASTLWAAAEDPKNSGNFTTASIPFSCARGSPLECSSVPNSPLAALQYVYSFGEDNRKDVYILASSGVYRVVRPSRCNFTCSKENETAILNPSPPPSHANPIIDQYIKLVVSLSSLLVSVAVAFEF